MQIKSESQLNTHLKEGTPALVYLIYSPDPALKNSCCQKLCKKLLGNGAGDFNLQSFEGDNFESQLLLNAVEALPFMAERKVVLVQNLDYCGMDKTQSDLLMDIVADVPTTTVLIINAAPDFGNSFDAKTKQKETKLIKAVDKVGCVCAIQPKTESEKAKWLEKRAAKNGCTIASQAAEALLQTCAGDMATLENEMDKLCAYVGQGGKITLEHILLLTDKSVDASVFDLAKRLCAGNYKGAMGIVDALLAQKYKPTVILSSLTSTYIDLYRCKAAIRCGVPATEVLRDFAYPNNQAFRVNHAMRDCRKHSMQSLRRAMAELAQADYLLKSSRAEDTVILQQAVTRLYLLQAEEGRV